MEKPRTSQIENAVLERITYANEETGYTVARVSIKGSEGLITVVGALAGAQPGESLRLNGWWKSHPQYGKQFEIHDYTTVLPATIQGIRRYLGSGLIKGIGPKFAERIVEHFGLDTLDVIEHSPERLVEVDGLGKKRTRMIAEAWEEQKAIKEVMLFLQGVNVSTSLAVRIFKHYGSDSIDVVRNEPYRLASDVWGIGFKTADTIAQNVGIPHDSAERVKAGIQFALSEATDSGHCYLQHDPLVSQSANILGVDRSLIESCVDQLVQEESLVREQLPAAEHASDITDAYYLVPFHRAEQSLATSLLRLLNTPADRLSAFQSVDWERAFQWFANHSGAKLAPEQADAVRLALTSRVAVLTGGPGCGKSFTVRAIVALARQKGAKITLVAPTGRAAKRLAELAHHEAATVHRLLQIRPGGKAAYNRDNPIDTDLIVVDETSMLDVLIANTLCRAVANGTHVLFVGDVDQLPSVGAGDVLRDLLKSCVLPSVRLTQIYRQAQQSGVVVNAHRINSGKMPEAKGYSDFFFFAEDDNEKVADLVVEIVQRKLPTKFGVDARRDVAVLCPKNGGVAGATALNEALQHALTPERSNVPEKRYGGRVFRIGDKVIQLRNDYDKGVAGVFNGTVGVITALSLEEQHVTVRTDEDEDVNYDFGELDELAHAYAVTIHRSQGSEYPIVVVPITTSAWMMLQRNLIYTAVTRAKKMVVLVGSKRAIAQAVRSVSAGTRNTGLSWRLQG